MAEHFERLFDSRGWSVIACGNLNISMGRMSGCEPYNVVLIDYSGPLPDRLKLIRFTRALEHRRTTAIVMIARNAEEAGEGWRARADMVLLWPVTAEALISAIEEQAK